MPADALRRQFRDHLADLEQREAARYIDLAVAWEAKSRPGETLAYFGGQWDQVEQRYTGKDPERCAVIRFNDSQLELATWAAWWAQERAAGRPRDFLGLFGIGDRGGGKTYASVGILGTLLVEFPALGGDPTVSWIVSRSHADRAEIDRTLTSIFPAAWYQYREWPQHTYRWITGATLANVSADDPAALRSRGRVDLLLVNEAGLVGHKVPFYAIPRIKDRGGLALLTANPPDSLKGQWILDLHERAEEAKEKGLPYPIRFLRIMSAGNADVDHEVGDQVAQVLRDIDPRAAKLDIDGRLLPVGDRAYFRWRKKEHVRDAPQLGDITAEFTKRRLGRSFDYVGGVDFQGTPHHAAVICKIFGSLSEPDVWVVDEFVAEESTEDDLLDMVDERGYTPESLLWVGDASGQWQDGKHSKNGRDSFKVFSSRRWRIVPPAAKKSDKGEHSKNPPVEKRVGLVNKLLGDPTKGLPVRLHVEHGCTKIAEALKECPWVKARYGGKPTGYYSHLSDALGYVIWWAFPAPTRRVDGPVALLGPKRNVSFFGGGSE